ncbi:hypothetical protein SSU05_1639 [Streptococcus suis 05ZYH33]|nr:hypothetical protein SSU05_1639 [Streptococcus suis 05ZYH33]
MVFWLPGEFEWTKVTFSLVGLMLICLKKVHNKQSMQVN